MLYSKSKFLAQIIERLKLQEELKSLMGKTDRKKYRHMSVHSTWKCKFINSVVCVKL